VRIKVANAALVLVTIVVVALAAAFCWKYLLYSYDTQRQVLAPGVELVQKFETRPQIPFGSDRFVVEQTLQFKGKTIWSSSIHGPGAPSRNFRASPNGRSVAFEDLSGEQLVSIVDVNTGQIVKVPVPEPLAARDDQYYVYPFEFVGWSQDSRALTFRVTGRLFLQDERRYLAYRELWTVDLDTLKATLIKRVDEKPWKEHLTWE
jgi:hypothetical protein